MTGQHQGGHERVQNDERRGKESKCVAHEDNDKPITIGEGELHNERHRVLKQYYTRDKPSCSATQTHDSKHTNRRDSSIDNYKITATG